MQSSWLWYMILLLEDCVEYETLKPWIYSTESTNMYTTVKYFALNNLKVAKDRTSIQLEYV